MCVITIVYDENLWGFIDKWNKRPFSFCVNMGQCQRPLCTNLASFVSRHPCIWWRLDLALAFHHTKINFGNLKFWISYSRVYLYLRKEILHVGLSWITVDIIRVFYPTNDKGLRTSTSGSGLTSSSRAVVHVPVVFISWKPGRTGRERRGGGLGYLWIGYSFLLEYFSKIYQSENVILIKS